jgi:hypothetical protein
MRVLRWLALLLVLLPFVVLIARLVHVGSGFHAVSDQALEELQTRDVGRHMVLIGPFSRDNWSHPGPAMFYVLAIPYWLTGGNSIGVWIGAAFLNGAAVATMSFVAKRHGGTALMLLTLLGSACLMRTLGADFLREPWNPYLPVLLFGALVFLVWAMTCGDVWALPAAAAVATFCAQTHIGYVILALPLFLGGTVWLALIVRRNVRKGFVPSLCITIGVLFVMWLPPIWDELTQPQGNLTRIVRYFEHPPPGPHYTVQNGYRLVASQFALIPEWLRRVPTLRPFTAEAMTLYKSPAPWLLLGFVAATVVLFRLRRRGRLYDSRAWRLAVVIAAALLLGIISIARTIGVAYAYRLRWTLVAGMIAMVLTLWAVWRVLAPRCAHGARRALGIVAVALIGAVASVDIVAAATVASPQPSRSTTVDALGKQVRANLPATAGDVVVFSPDVVTGYEPGLILWLERHGIAATVLPFEGLAYGSDRVHTHPPLRALVTVASNDAAAVTAKLPGVQIIALAGDASSADIAQRIAQSAALNREYLAGKFNDAEFGARNAALIRAVPNATAVFLQGPIAITSPRRQRPR